MYPLQKCLQQTFLTNCVSKQVCYDIDLMHILPPVTAKGFDGSHHPRFAEWAYAHALNFGAA